MGVVVVLSGSAAVGGTGTTRERQRWAEDNTPWSQSTRMPWRVRIPRAALRAPLTRAPGRGGA
jgi:hypothetical protein